MTPLEISIALWYTTRPGDYGNHNGDNNLNAPAVQDSIQRFVAAGLLRRTLPVESKGGTKSYIATEGLQVYVDYLCSVPLPEQKWVMPASPVPAALPASPPK